MNHPDYNSPSELKSFLEEHGMAMQKKFGQNFMVNPAARTKIIDLLSPQKDETIWEVGPGLGCMTDEIMQRGANIKVFEIDRGFIALLRQFFEKQEEDGQFQIIEGDVLKTWKKEFSAVSETPSRPSKLSGNLPYNIAATFVADTITAGLVFDKCVFTVQKEVAQRMAAKPGSENYSSFSALCQWGYDVKLGIELAAGNFWPRPNVASQAVLMTKKEVPYQCKSPKTFVKVIHTLFSARRKTINNNIKPILPQGMTADELFDRAKVSKMQRAEELMIEDFIRIADAIFEANEACK